MQSVNRVGLQAPCWLRPLHTRAAAAKPRPTCFCGRCVCCADDDAVHLLGAGCGMHGSHIRHQRLQLCPADAVAQRQQHVAEIVLADIPAWHSSCLAGASRGLVLHAPRSCCGPPPRLLQRQVADARPDQRRSRGCGGRRLLRGVVQRQRHAHQLRAALLHTLHAQNAGADRLKVQLLVLALLGCGRGRGGGRQAYAGGCSSMAPGHGLRQAAGGGGGWAHPGTRPPQRLGWRGHTAAPRWWA